MFCRNAGKTKDETKDKIDKTFETTTGIYLVQQMCLLKANLIPSEKNFLQF